VELFIDHLSKQLARTTSRRSMLSITSRTLFASFVTSTGIGKLWGQTTTSACPACGTCERCNVNSGKCGYQCEKCAAASLCSQAQQFPSYTTLQNFLAQQQFTGSAPQALEIINSDDTITSVLATNYIGTAPNQTALLTFTVTTTGLSAYVMQFLNGSPVFGYFVSPDGQVQQILPPYQLTAPTANASARAARKGGTSAACQSSCHMACELAVEDVTQCLEYVIFGCLLTGELYFACAVLGASMCFLIGVLECEQACEGLTSALGLQANVQAAAASSTGGTCPFQTGQPCGSVRCGTCETCINGVCAATTCPFGYSCDSTMGTCVCSNLCGTTCCSAGQTCSNGTCVTTCSSGETPCGTTCCAAGQVCCGTTCCSPGQICSNGACMANPCPTGTTVCQGAINLACCSPTTVCCSSAVSSTCIPAGNSCCISPAGIMLSYGCPPNYTCCSAPSASIGPWCCQPGLSCGSGAQVGGCV
jgi:hypothetical protein